MPRFRDTSLQCSRPSVARKDRIRDPKDVRRTVDPAALEMLEYLISKRRAGRRET
ncbi:MAG: hypothetical protein HPY58_09235 [Firmicutes bacterium]|nr:hypothetical protein [Bacillota bacterium]